MTDTVQEEPGEVKHAYLVTIKDESGGTYHSATYRTTRGVIGAMSLAVDQTNMDPHGGWPRGWSICVQSERA